MCVCVGKWRQGFIHQQGQCSSSFLSVPGGGRANTAEEASRRDRGKGSGWLPPSYPETIWHSGVPPPSPSSSSHRSLFNTNSQAPSVIALYSPTRSLPPRSLKRENPLHDWATSTGKKSLFFFCFPLNQGFCVLMQNSPFSFFKSPPWSFHPKVNSAWQLVTCFKCL